MDEDVDRSFVLVWSGRLWISCLILRFLASCLIGEVLGCVLFLWYGVCWVRDEGAIAWMLCWVVLSLLLLVILCWGTGLDCVTCRRGATLCDGSEAKSTSLSSSIRSISTSCLGCTWLCADHCSIRSSACFLNSVSSFPIPCVRMEKENVASPSASAIVLAFVSSEQKHTSRFEVARRETHTRTISSSFDWNWMEVSWETYQFGTRLTRGEGDLRVLSRASTCAAVSMCKIHERSGRISRCNTPSDLVSYVCFFCIRMALRIHWFAALASRPALPLVDFLRPSNSDSTTRGIIRASGLDATLVPCNDWILFAKHCSKSTFTKDRVDMRMFLCKWKGIRSFSILLSMKGNKVALTYQGQAMCNHLSIDLRIFSLQRVSLPLRDLDFCSVPFELSDELSDGLHRPS